MEIASILLTFKKKKLKQFKISNKRLKKLSKCLQTKQQKNISSLVKSLILEKVEPFIFKLLLGDMFIIK